MLELGNEHIVVELGVMELTHTNKVRKFASHDLNMQCLGLWL